MSGYDSQRGSGGPVPRRVLGMNNCTHTCNFCGCVQVVPEQGAQSGEEVRKGAQSQLCLILSPYTSFLQNLASSLSAGKLIPSSCGEHGPLLLGSSMFLPPQRELGVPPPPTSSTYSCFAFITLVVISRLLICSHGKTELHKGKACAILSN